MEREIPYEEPVVQDYGDLLSMTQAGEIQGFEDAGPKFSILDVSNGQFP
jgi:hypothetical protein